MALPRGAMGLSAVSLIVEFPDHNHLLFLFTRENAHYACQICSIELLARIIANVCRD